MTIEPARMLLVGCYGPPVGTGTGITLVEHNLDDDTLTIIGSVDTPSPSFLTEWEGVVYAVEEASTGAVGAFRRTSARKLQQFSGQPTEGAHPCHLVVHPSGRFLLTANYTSGSLAVHPLRADGSVGALCDLMVLNGHGPHPERQSTAHPHMITPVGDNELAVADLGSDRIWRLSINPANGKLTLLPGGVRTTPGSGTRQVLFEQASSTAYALGELDGSLTVATWPGPDQPIITPAALVTASLPLPPGNLAAALVGSPDGHRLYVSHRGADMVAVIDVTGQQPKLVDEFASGGRWPRHLALVDATVYCANQMSDAIAVLNLKAGTAAERTRPHLVVASPSCVLIPHLAVGKYA